jgi:CBS domain-containing protein
MKLDSKTAAYFREQFRESRAIALRDAEGFQEVLFTLERLGSYLKGSIQDLGHYARDIQNVASTSPLADEIPARFPPWHSPFSRLYELVRDARNDALHQGAFARHLTRSAIQLALVLEDALMSSQNTAGDYMVRDPVCASLWQPLSFIRQQMLANSFTYLPVWRPRQWELISDYSLARYLRGDARRTRLASTLEDAVNDGLRLDGVTTCFTDSPVNDLLEKSEGKPVLVVDREQTERLVGIVTPFDLL